VNRKFSCPYWELNLGRSTLSSSIYRLTYPYSIDWDVIYIIVWSHSVYEENLCSVPDRITVTQIGPEDGTHVPKHVGLDIKFLLQEIVMC
jgi:hypothetical protein